MIFNIALLLANLVILAVIYILLRRRIDFLTDTGKITDRLVSEMDQLMAEMNNATERNITIIEDRIKALNQAVEKADSRITLLKKMELQTEQKAASQLELGYGALRTLRTAAAGKPSPESSGIGTPPAAVQRSKTEQKPGEEPVTASEKEDVEETPRRKVLEMYRQGLDSSVISSSLGLNLGEVELIISIYRQTDEKKVW